MIDTDSYTADLQQTMAHLQRERNLYCDTMMKVLCVKTIAEARKLVRDAFREVSRWPKLQRSVEPTPPS